MPEPPKPSLLQQLRTQSDALRAQDTAARQPFEAAVQAIDSTLWRAFRWLDEAMGHLEVIRPKVAHLFPLDGILTISSRISTADSWRSGAGVRRRRRSPHRDVLPARRHGPFILRVNPASAAGIEERLRAASTQFQYQTEQDAAKVVRYGLFHVQPIVSASVRFQPDYARQVVDVTLRNVDRFESVVLEFAPERLDEPALEDLVKFMLGEESGFLRRAPLALIKRRDDDKPVPPSRRGPTRPATRVT